MRGAASTGRALAALMHAHMLSVMVVTDTGLRQDQALVLPFACKNTLHFLHGGGGPHSGVGVLVDTSHVSATPCTEAELNSAPAFAQFFRVKGCGLDITLGAIYLPPRVQTPAALAPIHAAIRAAARAYDNVVLMGDFNAHVSDNAYMNGERHGHADETNAAGRRLEQLLQELDLVVLNGDIRYTRARPTYVSAARDPETGTPLHTTLVDYTITSPPISQRVTDVFTAGVPLVDTDHHMVVTVFAAAPEDVQRAQQARLIQQTQRHSLKGVLHPAWKQFSKNVDRSLRHARCHVFGPGRQRGRINVRGRRVNLAHALRFLMRVLKRHLHVVTSAPAHEYIKPPNDDRVREAQRALGAARGLLRRLRRRAEANPGAPDPRRRLRAAVKHLHAVKARRNEAERQYAHALRRATHAGATAALYHRSTKVRDQKRGHLILMASARHGPRHGAGVCKLPPPLRHPETGKLASNEMETIDGFTHHLTTLHAGMPPHPADVAANAATAAAVDGHDPGSDDDGGLNADITALEVITAIMRLKLHKSGGAGGVNTNIIRGGRRAPRRNEQQWDDELCQWLAAIFTAMLRQQEVPGDLVLGQVSFMPKPDKEDENAASSFRPITVMPVLAKVFEAILETRIRKHLEAGVHGVHLDEGQFGFREGRGVHDSVFLASAIRQVASAPTHPGWTTAWSSAGDTRVRASDHVPDPHGMRIPGRRPTTHAQAVFCDLKSAFDVTDHAVLFRRLAACGITGRVWGVIRAFYRAHRRTVKVGSQKGHRIKVNCGVPQGCILSPLLYICYITMLATVVKTALKEGKVDTSRDIDFSSPPAPVVGDDGSIRVRMGPVSLVCFADDAAILANTAEDMRLALQALAWGLHRLRCQLHLGKTEHLVTSMNQQPQPWWRVDEATGTLVENGMLKRVTHVKRYLGMYVEANGSMQEQRRRSMRAASTAWKQCGAAVSSHGLYCPRIGVQLIHNACGHLLFGCEVWGATGRDDASALTALTQSCARILEAPGAPKLYVRGELGLMTPTGTMYSQRLAYWFELLLQPPTRYTKWMYQLLLATYVDQHYNGGANWCKGTHHMLMHMSQGEGSAAAAFAGAWADGDLDAQRHWLQGALGTTLPAASAVLTSHTYSPWRRLARSQAAIMVRDWEEQRWRQQLRNSHTLELFAALHPRLQFAGFLDSVHTPDATRLRVRLRSGNYPLRAHTAYRQAHNRAHGAEYRRAAICPLCNNAPETVAHFVLHCPVLQAVRGDLPRRLLGVCKHPALRQLLVPPHKRQPEELVLLALVLGGDLSLRPGLEDFMEKAGPARRDQSCPHPARDRLAALQLTADILLDLERERSRRLTPIAATPRPRGRPHSSERPGSSPDTDSDDMDESEMLNLVPDLDSSDTEDSDYYSLSDADSGTDP